MVTIRLARTGAKKRPFYHVVVTDSRTPRDGRFIERLGFFNPVAAEREDRLRIDVERVVFWKGRGAQCTDAVERLLRQLRRAPAGGAPPATEGAGISPAAEGASAGV
jgi:small subunit ribosomal protein S16